MTAFGRFPAGPWCSLSLLAALALPSAAQSSVGGGLPPTAPTQSSAPSARLAGTPVTATPSASHAAHVRCAGGTLEVEASNSSLNGILRSIARCTGLRVTGSVAEQRVFGTYGPAAPATVLGTLLDGTGSNMLLLEAANGEPAQLILTPRTGGATPPAPASYAENEGAATDDDEDTLPQTRNAPRGPAAGGVAFRPQRSSDPGVQTGQRDPRQGVNGDPGSPVTSPPAIPIGNNNVLGSPANTSPTASTYPTTNSVPLDSVATPSTTPSPSGIVDAPNPPAAGSDTAAALNGAPRGTPGTTNLNPTTTTGNNGSPANSSGAQPSTELTPEQVFQQLQQRLQQQQQQQQQQQESPQPSSNPQ